MNDALSVAKAEYEKLAADVTKLRGERASLENVPWQSESGWTEAGHKGILLDDLITKLEPKVGAARDKVARLEYGLGAEAPEGLKQPAPVISRRLKSVRFKAQEVDLAAVRLLPSGKAHDAYRAQLSVAVEGSAYEAEQRRQMNLFDGIVKGMAERSGGEHPREFTAETAIALITMICGVRIEMGALARSSTETIEALSARVAELETRPVFRDAGVYHAGSSYKTGEGVTHDGSFWIAQKNAPGAPGTAASGWRLAVKRGRDGKDAGAPHD